LTLIDKWTSVGYSESLLNLMRIADTAESQGEHFPVTPFFLIDFSHCKFCNYIISPYKKPEILTKSIQLPVEAFLNFDEEQAVNIISSTFHKTQGIVNYNPTFQNNPIDKIIQLHEEKIALYERMLKEKDEMMERLERLIGGSKF
jgi:hypothetical protein